MSGELTMVCGVLLGIKTPNDRPYSKAVFSGFTRSFKKTREENLNILVQS